MASAKGNPVAAIRALANAHQGNGPTGIGTKMANSEKNFVDAPKVANEAAPQSKAQSKSSDSNNNPTGKQDKKLTSGKFLGAKNNKSKNNKTKTELKCTIDKNISADSSAKPSGQKNLVEELKLFQNSQLLNQQDPIEQLQRQLDELIRDDDGDNKNRLRQNYRSNATQNYECNSSNQSRLPNLGGNNLTFNKYTDTDGVKNHAQNLGLSNAAMHLNDANLHEVVDANNESATSNHELYLSNRDNIFTIKKGILWQQQNYDRFHQRLFCRWKKRYFILTNDYLVCFKRSTSKVGHSEMGKFLYKTSLGDITKLEWLKPRKSDKGAIVLNIKGQFKLFLWCKENLDDWMLMIDESIQRSKTRRSNFMSSSVSFGPFDGNNNCNSSNKLNQRQVKQTNEDKQLTVNGCKQEEALVQNLHENSNKDATKRQINGEQGNFAMDKKSTRDADRLAPNADAISSSRQNSTIQTYSSQDTNEVQLASSNSNLGSQLQKSQRKESRDNNQMVGEKLFATNEPLPPPTTTTKCSINQGDRNDHDDIISKADRIGQSKLMMINDAGQANAEDHHDNGSLGHRAKRSAGSSITSRQASGQAISEENFDGHGIIIATEQPRDTNSGSDLGSLQSRSCNSGPDSVASSRTRRQTTQAANTNSIDSSRSNTSASVSGSVRKSGADSRASSSRGSTGSRALQRHQQQQQQQQPLEPTKATKQQPTSQETSGSLAEFQKVASYQQGSCASNTTSNHQASEIIKRQQLFQQDKSRPQANNNLIRRDDSWQSLVSLTRIGKSPIQVAQRSLYTQHIMAPSDSADSAQPDLFANQQRAWPKTRPSNGKQQHSSINIESTVTPIRSGPALLRQHSIQSGAVSRKFSPLPPIMSQQAVSFDQTTLSVATGNQVSFTQDCGQTPEGGGLMPNSPLQANHRSISYQNKLLQLQMMHNNNGDYGQIYGPAESVATNHYGYYSMRSNLKSAASEFSFIRPNSSSFQQTRQAAPILQPQSTLPHQSSSYQLASVNGQQQFQRQTPMRSSLVMVPMSAGQLEAAANSNCGQHQHQFAPIGTDRITLAELVASSAINAPNRELPLKPSKRRTEQQTLMDEQLGAKGSASSSLGSSIVCFLRRAFSRRSTKFKRRSKGLAAESSCSSSSLGNFDERYPNIHVLPSAFSTGGKSLDEQLSLHKQQQQQQQQQQNSQRMVDMIEAFKNKTLIEGSQCSDINLANAAPSNQNLSDLNAANGMHQTPLALSGSGSGGGQANYLNREGGLQMRPVARNQFGSPLHKSNSISTTMGLSGLNATNSLQRNYVPQHLYKQARQQQPTLLYDNQRELVAPSADCGGGGGSPMLLRSAKVLSANLTPIFANKSNAYNDITGEMSHQTPSRQLFMSPRSRPDHHLPRPSSIYGQPSMISSSPPIPGGVGQNSNNNNCNNFGLHRSSMHGGHYNDRNSGYHQVNHQQASLAELRASLAAPSSLRNYNHHHQLVKVPQFLDTTREVSEELISPTEDITTTSGPLNHSTNNHQQQRRSNQGIISTNEDNPLAAELACGRDNGDSSRPVESSYIKFNHQRQAIVNPILQSPTMQTIYDNHPMLNVQNQEQAAYSPNNTNQHYDNHLYSRQQQQQQNLSSIRLANDRTCELLSVTADSQMVHDYQNRRVNLSKGVGGSSTSNGDLNTPSRLAKLGKPAAIVAPTTPSHSYNLGSLVSELAAEPPARRATIIMAKQQQVQSPLAGSLSPLLRSGPSCQQLQQSPLASQHDSSRRSRNQAGNIINSSASAINFQHSMYLQDNDKSLDSGTYHEEPSLVVNIAGAPGINLEPSLAASLLRGTNIDAFELSSGYNSNSSIVNSNIMMTPSSRRIYGSNQAKGPTNNNSKTFLVATRLFKSMAAEAAAATTTETETDIEAKTDTATTTTADNQDCSYDNVQHSSSTSRDQSEDVEEPPEQERSMASMATKNRLELHGERGRLSRIKSKCTPNDNDDDEEAPSGTSSSVASVSSRSSSSATTRTQCSIRGPARLQRDTIASGTASKSSPQRKKLGIPQARRPSAEARRRSSASEESSTSQTSGHLTEPDDEAHNWITSKLVQ